MKKPYPGFSANCEIILQSRLKTGPGGSGHRIRSAVNARRALNSDRAVKGHIRDTRFVLDKKYKVPTYMMKITMPGIPGPGDSMGKGLSRDQAYVSCAAESVERVRCSLHDEDELLTASFRELKGRAVDPVSLGVFRNGCYCEDLKIDWVEGWNLTRGRPVYVPAMLGLYISRNYKHRYYRGNPLKTKYTYSDSNGCSTGNCMEEAVLHGLLEVIERDSVMLNARLGLRPPALAVPDILRNTSNRGLAELLRRIYADKTAILKIKYLTLDLGVCVTACVLADCEDRLVTVGYGAHLDLSTAIARALTESFQARALSQGGREGADTKRFKELYSQRLKYLTSDSSGTIPYQSIKSSAHGDILEDIRFLVSLLEKKGLEVVAVNRTSPAYKIPVVKVLVPGLQRVDWANLFGSELYGGAGGDRCYTARSKSGLATGLRELSGISLDQFTFY